MRSTGDRGVGPCLTLARLPARLRQITPLEHKAGGFLMQPLSPRMEAALAAVIARERLLKDHNSPDPLREIFRPVVGRQEGADKP